MRTIIEYMQLCHIHLYQQIARKKVARVNAALQSFLTKRFHLKLSFLNRFDLIRKSRPAPAIYIPAAIDCIVASSASQLNSNLNERI